MCIGQFYLQIIKLNKKIVKFLRSQVLAITMPKIQDVCTGFHECVTLFRASVMERESFILLWVQSDCISLYVPLLHACNHYLRTHKHEKVDGVVYLHLFQMGKRTQEQIRWKCPIEVVSSQVPALNSSQVTRLTFEFWIIPVHDLEVAWWLRKSK